MDENEFASDFLSYVDRSGVFYIYGPDPEGPVASGCMDLPNLTWLKSSEAPDEESMLELGHEPLPVLMLTLSVEYSDTANQIVTFCS
jgi:hypothetical protein